MGWVIWNVLDQEQTTLEQRVERRQRETGRRKPFGPPFEERWNQVSQAVRFNRLHGYGVVGTARDFRHGTLKSQGHCETAFRDGRTAWKRLTLRGGAAVVARAGPRETKLTQAREL